MKSNKTIKNLFLSSLLIANSYTAFAEEICYQVSGEVSTTNVTSTRQEGVITLTLLDQASNITEYNEEVGSISGSITGAKGMGISLLSHTVSFNDYPDDSFYTEDDVAILNGALDVAGNGTLCSFNIHETITKISAGTGFFENITKVKISADGYISNCPTENHNLFALSGILCREASN